MIRTDRERSGRRRAIVILPNAFTLGNLFFGFWAMVASVNGDFSTAAWLIFAAGVADGLDGRVARLAKTGSLFGVELDSLVDLVSFGIAPAVFIYTLQLQAGDWSWTLAYIYAAAVAVRLARFNIEQGGRAHLHFHGLPSPVAGITIAAFYPFSQTAFFSTYLVDWPWTRLIGGFMIVLAGLMLSHVIYPAIPRLSLRNTRGRVAIGIVVLAIVLLVWNPQLVVFPVGLTYVTVGVVRAAVLGLLDRLPDKDPLEEEFEAEETDTRDLEYEDIRPHWDAGARRSTRSSGEKDDG
ncbi:MAG: CDP-diacylglycerol--serine O-phosphatidyltransferase [Gemmatimonadetes bacterium]|uniref:CDP-diacylglycerol--serine O-phosphatidyltransferase n=1 Tax=Candidatus Kutchimonas denitrificans TaxID=3056748 RepID=A0AAE5CBI7_9BACT|nr:CDP-diacylglycerol--serine O-phosphatidyltransferase [Gemmatimonadota bacterium]NIR74598.1 CDP-diacylglycerol--serine O-phosphatidyltransferase [Candidatus Kutchimonas denitrificans]NIS02788.1 CDP-diacylglycerol--serine O-phosphatidyltransferase [Gemmatimonadota bacterium]NIT68949.1 CDP-diacylglycerol--serine O-phosphatidyltransferase [Gemmatimonadota bacterium]NIU52254.1 CDP-diacylglycerol--serine O-phosphatidyltransferase [Gemmatimonadota bacterium]